MKLSIVIPCYNEAKNLPLIFERLGQAIKRSDIEVILVDNGSIDGTKEALAGILPQYPFARSLRVELNQGYGFGILQGLRSGCGEYLSWTHADMQADPADVIKALEIAEGLKEKDKVFIKGKRKGRPWTDSIFTIGMAVFETLFLGVYLDDINAQPNLFHRSFFESWENPPHDFSLDLYAFYLARRQKLKLIRFPVFFKKRAFGSSHWNFGWRSKWRFIMRTLDFSLKLKRSLG